MSTLSFMNLLQNLSGFSGLYRIVHMLCSSITICDTSEPQHKGRREQALQFTKEYVLRIAYKNKHI